MDLSCYYEIIGLEYEIINRECTWQPTRQGWNQQLLNDGTVRIYTTSGITKSHCKSRMHQCLIELRKLSILNCFYS